MFKSSFILVEGPLYYTYVLWEKREEIWLSHMTKAPTLTEKS